MDCADKYSLFGDRSEWERWHSEQTRLRSLAAKEKRFKKAAHEFLDSQPELKAAFDALPAQEPDPKNPSCYLPDPRPVAILRDMLRKLNQYGSLSQAQIDFALRLSAELARPKEEKPEEVHVPAPTGRVEVQGVVVSVKGHESDWGYTEKMTVKVETPDGSWLCWATVPSCLDVERGNRIAFTATLEPGREPHFAFAKRPSKARVVEEAK
jgi:hypothetical protein